MSNAEAKQVTVPEAVEAARERFQQIAPRGLDFTAEQTFAIQLLNNNDYLKKVALENPLSLQAAVINVAAIGLSLNPAKKQAYLIPRNVKHGDRWVSKIFLEPSYMGLCDLATASGSIKWVQANTVHANDQFTDNGPGERPTHIYNPFDPPTKRGEMIGAYCVARTDGGDYLTCMMPMHEIYAVRDRSEAWKRGKSGPWATDEGEQVKKTVLRRAWKTWPKTETLDRLAAAVDLSNNNEGFEPILTAPALGQYTPDQKAYFDQMISQSDKIGMFLFIRSLPEGVSASLFNSFEKGTKTRYKDIVRKLESEGAAQLREITEVVQSAANDGDTYAIAENLQGLSKDAIEFVRQQCEPGASSLIDQALRQAAA
jgi:phage RecT family recombinase